MNKLLVCCAFFVYATVAFAQKESFDVVTYTVPKNWKKEITATTISYTKINTRANNWCRINIIKSTSSKGSIAQDFESEWQELVVKSYNPTEVPQLNDVQETGGWKIKAGAAKFIFNNGDATALLTTATGYNRCVSIVATTNNNAYLKDIEALLASVELKKITEEKLIPTSIADKVTVVGSWGVSSTIASAYNMHINEGSIITQYTFNANGTYSFYIKTFKYQLDKLLLTKETGTYQVSGNNLTVNPQRSVTEAWSRKDGTDNWGKLLSSDKKALEKIIYSFNTQDFGLGPVLILKAPAATKRDGHFNNSEKNAWYYPAKSNVELIKLPG